MIKNKVKQWANHLSVIPADIGFTGEGKISFEFVKPFGIRLTLFYIYLTIGWMKEKDAEPNE